LKYPKAQPLRDDVKVRAHVALLMKSKRNEQATSIPMQAQVEEMYFYLILSFSYVTLLRWMLHDLLASQSAQKPKRGSLRYQNTIPSEFKALYYVDWVALLIRFP
jgi:hypothetical protein